MSDSDESSEWGDTLKGLAVYAGFILVVVLIFGGSCSANRGSTYNPDGTYDVTCSDDSTSHSGGHQGACSHHGGVL